MLCPHVATSAAPNPSQFRKHLSNQAMLAAAGKSVHVMDGPMLGYSCGVKSVHAMDGPSGCLHLMQPAQQHFSGIVCCGEHTPSEVAASLGWTRDAQLSGRQRSSFCPSPRSKKIMPWTGYGQACSQGGLIAARQNGPRSRPGAVAPVLRPRRIHPRRPPRRTIPWTTPPPILKSPEPRSCDWRCLKHTRALWMWREIR